ncbi:DUF2313 domain-containing protein [Brevibacillus laterosporus]|nr:putative phage tail protein [Brevibacillus laterosporus]TPG74040.1 DUF2313 domain-containing protein [Brevibacillus laterosporus]
MDIPSNLRGYFARRWFLHGGEEHERLLQILSSAITVCEEIAEKVLKEILVQTAEESLRNCEKELGLSSGENLSLEERQNRILARNYERGGPTNTADFERALSTLANAKAKVIPNYPDFSVVYQLALNNHFQLNLPLLEEYIRRNKLGHLRHSYSIGGLTNTLTYSTNRSEPIVYESIPLYCGAFYAGGESDLC